MGKGVIRYALFQMTLGKAISCRPTVRQERLFQIHRLGLFRNTFKVLLVTKRALGENIVRFGLLSFPSFHETYRYTIVSKLDQTLSRYVGCLGTRREQAINVCRRRGCGRQDSKFITNGFPFFFHVKIPVRCELCVRIDLQTKLFISQDLVGQRTSERRPLGLNIVKGYLPNLIIVRTLGTFVFFGENFRDILTDRLTFDGFKA